ncbi:lipoprotein [Spiroplasma cantharicola]|uniref:Lipoprotein n=1 Tax=Spiroplasma cantharicola TaxID=362837 RepID=A0A0M5KLG4_9MOLU|nr:lipoprotein [Spiroplasma cantharicola]ALD66213.1 hypothetical protein SCANT_v1c03030 [Spiroplasma cantharicola]
MKKLLAVLGSITLVTSSSFTVVSCFGGKIDPPEDKKTTWTDEEILERFGSLEINQLENGDLELSSKEDHFKIWSGSNDGNKYKRVIDSEDVEKNSVNFLYDSLLPTGANLENPFGIELMSAFYVGKSEQEVNTALAKSHSDAVKEFGSEMTNNNQWNLREKNAFSIFLGSGPREGNTFSCTRMWYKTIKVKTIQGEDMYIGLFSLYVDYFIGYVTNNLSSWIKDFFEEYKIQLESPNLEIKELVNESANISTNPNNQHLNLKFSNANFKFNGIMEYKRDENSELESIKIFSALNLYIKDKIWNHSYEFNSKYENSNYKDFLFDDRSDLNDPNNDPETHYNNGFEIWGPNNKRWDYNSIIYTKIDIVNKEEKNNF